jgi:hypothetical protein
MDALDLESGSPAERAGRVTTALRRWPRFDTLRTLRQRFCNGPLGLTLHVATALFGRSRRPTRLLPRGVCVNPSAA